MTLNSSKINHKNTQVKKNSKLMRKLSFFYGKKHTRYSFWALILKLSHPFQYFHCIQIWRIIILRCGSIHNPTTVTISKLTEKFTVIWIWHHCGLTYFYPRSKKNLPAGKFCGLSWFWYSSMSFKLICGEV